eukprot:scaffold4461_cov48-Attheya_sp.AAC.2
MVYRGAQGWDLCVVPSSSSCGSSSGAVRVRPAQATPKYAHHRGASVDDGTMAHRHMSRGTDFYFKVDWEDVWSLKEHFEPVLIFVCLPYLSHRPDFNRINSLLDRFRGAVLQENMGVVREVLHPPGNKPFPVRADYDEDGDIILEPGVMSVTHFRNITGRNPVSWKASDNEMLEFIWHGNLDAFWDRSRNTVSSNLSDAWRMEMMGKRLEMGSMAPPMGPFPLKDIMGMRFAIAILDRSLGAGQNEEFVQ